MELRNVLGIPETTQTSNMCSGLLYYYYPQRNEQTINQNFIIFIQHTHCKINHSNDSKLCAFAKEGIISLFLSSSLSTDSHNPKRECLNVVLCTLNVRIQTANIKQSVSEVYENDRKEIARKSFRIKFFLLFIPKKERDVNGEHEHSTIYCDWWSA